MKTGTLRVTYRVLQAAHPLLLAAVVAIGTLWRGNWNARNAVWIVTFGELGALASWAGLGRARWPRRLTMVALGGAASFGVLAATQTSYAPLLWIECLVLPSAFLFLLVLAVVSLPETRRSMPGQSSRASADWQFTLSELLVLTGGIGVLLAVAKQFFLGDLEIAPMLLVATGSQTGVLFAVLAAQAMRLRRLWLAGAACACLTVGVVVQSYLSAHWFWLLLGKLRAATPGELWEDLLSIPLTMLLTSSLTAATMLASRASSNPTRSR